MQNEHPWNSCIPNKWLTCRLITSFSCSFLYSNCFVFSWIVGLHRHQHKLHKWLHKELSSSYVHYHTVHAVIIHLLCDTNRPNSVSNLHYVHALPGPETTVARNGCQSEQCHGLSGSLLDGQHILKRNERQKASVEQKMCLKENEKQEQQHPVLLDGVDTAESTSSDEIDWNVRTLKTSNERLWDGSRGWWIWGRLVSLILLDIVNDKLLSCRVAFKTHLLHHHSQTVNWE